MSDVTTGGPGEDGPDRQQPGDPGPVDPGRPGRRGSRHLRIGIEIGRREPTITSMWLVDQPTVQPARLQRPVLTRVRLGNRTVLVDSHEDPRIVRSHNHPDLGHHVGREETGQLTVSVPFDGLLELGGLAVEIVDTSNLRLGEVTIASADRLFESPPSRMRKIRSIGIEAVRAHRDWPPIAAALGIPEPAGRFEIYVDRAGRHRWRLRRPDGQIVADGGQGYDSLTDLEVDLRWIRRHAAEVPITRLED